MPAYILGGATVLGGMFGASSSSSSAKRSVKFQREMAKNKYQYLMQDLESAGLNPILAAQSATAGPAGANAPVIPYMNPLGDGINTGKDVYLAGKQGEKVNKEVELLGEKVWESKFTQDQLLAGTEVKYQEAKRIAEETKRIVAETDKIYRTAAMVDADKELVYKNIQMVNAQLEKAKQFADIYDEDSFFGGVLTWMEAISTAIGLKSGVGVGFTPGRRK